MDPLPERDSEHCTDRGLKKSHTSTKKILAQLSSINVGPVQVATAGRAIMQLLPPCHWNYPSGSLNMLWDKINCKQIKIIARFKHFIFDASFKAQTNTEERLKDFQPRWCSSILMNRTSALRQNTKIKTLHFKTSRLKNFSNQNGTGAHVFMVCRISSWKNQMDCFGF